jgi:hypothetical protein
MSLPERDNHFPLPPEPKHRYGKSKGSELVFGKEDERDLDPLDTAFIGAAGVLLVTGVYINIKAINSFYEPRKKAVKAGFIPPRMPKPIPFNGLFRDPILEDWPLERFDRFAKQYGYDDYPKMKAAAEERDMTVEELAWGILEERGVV